jgi:hypothetical protein
MFAMSCFYGRLRGQLSGFLSMLHTMLRFVTCVHIFWCVGMGKVLR